uniref:RNA helicase n=1 Tax=Chelonoidis abingdonii TaxID=106734 RepID=A0A8C0HHM4_CHEAB
MDAYGLFRQLGAGARFDVKRFSQDARRFKHPNISENGLGTNGSKKSKVKIQPLESHMDEKADDSEERLNAGTARKRKQDTGNFEGKKRKRKTQGSEIFLFCTRECSNSATIEQKNLVFPRVEWLVVDESDKLFEDGKSGFRDQLASIFLACTSHVVKRALFSATFAFDVEQWCKLNLDNIILVSVGARNAAAETVDQELLFVGSETGKLLAMRDLVKKGFTPPVLVFVQSIERAKELFHELIYEGINVDVIHADKTQQQRDNVVHSFRAGKIWVLICTALLARGIDFKGVNMVINYDFPTSAVEYIHRIGRTGRAGHTGKAVTFFTEDDKPLLRSVANVIQQAGCPVPDYIKAFHKLQSKQKKKLIKKPLEREHIRTTPQYLLEKAKKKKYVP